MTKSVKLKAVEVGGMWRYFVFPSQMHVNKFLDCLETCEICDIEWVDSERVAVKSRDAAVITIKETTVMTRAEYEIAKQELLRLKQEEADRQESELAEKDLDDEMSAVTQEEIEEQQEKAGVPDEELLEPGESDPRD